MSFRPPLVALLIACLANSLCAETVRFATFNVSFYDAAAGKLAERLSKPGDPQAAAVAEIIQRVRPDVLLLNEVDYESSSAAVKGFLTHYLAVGQHVSGSDDGPAQPIDFAYQFQAPSNTGQPSGHDLDRSGDVVTQTGTSAYGGDCWGYGEYPGKYAMVLLSRYLIDESRVRTFQHFRWQDMPRHRIPTDWYSAEALEKFPLSSKSHWDVPIKVAGNTIHVLASHPTPPTYDGPEDRNGRRNHDEIRFWVDYITPGNGHYIYDDRGNEGGLQAGEKFVIMGDLNGDPVDGQGRDGIARLLKSSRVATQPAPTSEGGAQQAALQGGSNDSHRGDPRLDTLDAADRDGPGNLRVDYVLPATEIKTIASGVFWPENTDTLFTLVGTHPFPSSDHRLVWVELEVSR